MQDIEKRNTLKFVTVAMNKLFRGEPTAPGNALYRADGSYSVLGQVLKAMGVGRRTLASVNKFGRPTQKNHGGDPWKSNYMSRLLLALAPGLTPERCASLARINASAKSANDFKQAVRVVLTRAGIRVKFIEDDEGKLYPRSKAAQQWRAVNGLGGIAPAGVVNGATDFTDDEAGDDTGF